jgi:hypothetical protein
MCDIRRRTVKSNIFWVQRQPNISEECIEEASIAMTVEGNIFLSVQYKAISREPVTQIRVIKDENH